MDFEKPMSASQGFIVYNILLDMIDMFLQEHVIATESLEQEDGSSVPPYPSLRMTTDMFLTIMNDLKNLNTAGMSFEKKGCVKIFENKLADIRNDKTEVFDSRHLGLFEGSTEHTFKASYKQDNEPTELKEFTVSDKDLKWLNSMGIRHN